MGNDKEFYDSQEFRETLKKYEQMKANGICSYFETEDLLDILSYYLYYDRQGEAEDVYTLAKRLHPGSTDVVKMKIRLLLAQGKAYEALYTFEKIQYIDDEDNLLLKAEIMLSLKRFKETRSIARGILKKNSITDDVSYEALELMLDCGAAQEVLDITTQALAEHNGNRGLLEIRAESLMELQKTDEAIYIYNNLLDGNPYSTFYWEQLGRIYYMTERYSKALECFEYESTIDDGIDYAKMMQGYCYHHLGCYNKSEEIFKAFARKYPENIMPQFYIALALTEKGETSAAMKAYKTVADIADETGDKVGYMLANINMAILYQKTGNNDNDTLACINKALRSDAAADEVKQLLLCDRLYYELRDKENMTFRDLNRTESKEWSMYELMFALGIHLFENGLHSMALYPLYVAQKTMPEPAECEAYIAYILHSYGGYPEEFKKMLRNALSGKSDKIFSLFGIPYDANMMPDEFMRRLG